MLLALKKSTLLITLLPLLLEPFFLMSIVFLTGPAITEDDEELDDIAEDWAPLQCLAIDDPAIGTLAFRALLTFFSLSITPFMHISLFLFSFRGGRNSFSSASRLIRTLSSTLKETRSNSDLHTSYSTVVVSGLRDCKTSKSSGSHDFNINGIIVPVILLRSCELDLPVFIVHDASQVSS